MTGRRAPAAVHCVTGRRAPAAVHCVTGRCAPVQVRLHSRYKLARRGLLIPCVGQTQGSRFFFLFLCCAIGLGALARARPHGLCNTLDKHRQVPAQQPGAPGKPPL